MTGAERSRRYRDRKRAARPAFDPYLNVDELFALSLARVDLDALKMSEEALAAMFSRKTQKP